MPDMASGEPLTRSSAPAALNDLAKAIEHASHWLPVQGPIEVFVHHNTLHALEHLSFHDAVRRAAEIYGAEPYLSETTFRELIATGRIAVEDIAAVLGDDHNNRHGEPSQDDLAESPPRRQSAAHLCGNAALGTRHDLHLAMMRYPLRSGPAAELRWLIAETDALSQFCSDVPSDYRARILEAHSKSTAEPSSVSAGQVEHGALEILWRTCCDFVQSAKMPTPVDSAKRPRDLLLASTGVDCDALVHATLIPFCAAFLDQGYASWSLPDRECGFLAAFVSLYAKPTPAAEPWLDKLPEALSQLGLPPHKSQAPSQAPAPPSSHTSPAPDALLESIARLLHALGIDDEDHNDFIAQTLLALPGWAGMLRQLSIAADWIVRPAPPHTLTEFLAVRLVLDRLAAEFVAREHLSFEGHARELRCELQRRRDASQDGELQSAFELFQLAQYCGWTALELSRVSQQSQAVTLLSEIAAFDSIARRRVFQEAFERGYRHATLAAVSENFQRMQSALDTGTATGTTCRGVLRPSFQICCCIDDREESFRRHLEEVDPRCDTFGAAGFFAIAMNYQGLADATYKPLCPVVITPQHFVRENVGYTFTGEQQRRATARKALGRLTQQVHAGSRSFLGGIVTSMLGSLAAFPLVARVLFPRLTSRIRKRASRFVQPPPVTQLQLERYKPEPGHEEGHIGYTIDEMVAAVERLLQDIGLTQEFARLVVIAGHGSSSVNNPHASAYNCGACAGKRGGPNARAFAQMANDFRVRSRLIERGISIPEDTWFLGAYHNTCDDSLGWFDLDRLPPSHFKDFEATKHTCDEATSRNAHERSRRFQSADLYLTSTEALRHVQRRSEDLSQVRPEYNHATDALCFVGRRSWSRNLFLDRRAFLTSYDPTQDDPSGTILARILAAAIPVCAGINLEYYFSAVDNLRFGSGSKLPHNLVSMLGVMEGAASDLRPGLYQQMIEIHEPMRLLFVIEATPEIMRGIIERNATIARLCRGQWVQLAVLDSASGELFTFAKGEFHRHAPDQMAQSAIRASGLPRVSTSHAWYSGQREHLGFAIVQASERREKTELETEPSGTARIQTAAPGDAQWT